MVKKHKYSRLMLALLALGLVSSFANADNLPAQNSVPNQLDDLANAAPTAFPSCDSKDYSWVDQSGKDSVKPVPVSDKAMILQADSITGQESGAHLAQGNVVGYRDGTTVNTDWLIYNQPTQHATGGGNVVLSKQYNVITGQWIDYYMDLDKGTVTDAKMYQAESNLYAEGKQIRVLNSKQFQVESGYFTSCDPSDPDWHIRSSLTNFDYQDSQGTARNATFYAESIPIVNFPYMQFPLGERRSGFLIPEFGFINSTTTSGAPTSGMMVGLPYYWNMAPDYDMTIEPKLYTNDGLMVTDQFRYKTDTGNGTMYTEQLPNDWQTGQDRYYWSLTDTHMPVQDLKVGYNFNQVSDSNYFVNFGNANSAVDNINLDRSVFANYTPEWGLLGIRAQGYQVLQPINQPTVSPIYSVLPQVTMNVKPQALGDLPVKVDLQSQYSNFSGTGLSSNNGASLQGGQRAVFYPSLTMPIQNQWGFVKPKFGYSYTNYQLDAFPGVQSSSSSVDRAMPITSLDTGLVFDRPISLGSSNYSQTFEPRIYYLYIPEVNQQNLPVFDTAPATYNINQLFSENRFVGYDRINMANDVTIGVNSKLINSANGNEAANWGIGYRYFITPENSFIYGNTTQQAQLFLPQPNLIAELGNKWTQALSTNASYQYSTVYQTVDAYNIRTSYNPEPFKVINAGFTYQYNLPLLYYAYTPGQLYKPNQYENQYAMDVSGQWPIIGNRWLIEGRANYDFTRGTILNWISGLEYNGGCWSMQLVYENYITNITNQTSAYFVQFSLKGLANIGQDPQGDLKMNIPGYVPVTSIH